MDFKSIVRIFVSMPLFDFARNVLRAIAKAVSIKSKFILIRNLTRLSRHLPFNHREVALGAIAHLSSGF